MDADLQRMIDVTGVSMPLAARIIGVVIDSGASQVEICTALSLVRTIIDLLPVPLVSENVGAPELHSQGA